MLFQDKDMVDFFLRYMFNDQVGQIATSHLVHADYEDEGIYSSVCGDLARKHSQAVDFAKTGRQVAPFEDDEKIRKYPDYKRKDHKPCYKSKWLLGVMHR